jgi:hypothetical protein
MSTPIARREYLTQNRIVHLSQLLTYDTKYPRI